MHSCRRRASPRTASPHPVGIGVAEAAGERVVRAADREQMLLGASGPAAPQTAAGLVEHDRRTGAVRVVELAERSVQLRETLLHGLLRIAVDEEPGRAHQRSVVGLEQTGDEVVARRRLRELGRREFSGHHKQYRRMTPRFG